MVRCEHLRNFLCSNCKMPLDDQHRLLSPSWNPFSLLMENAASLLRLKFLDWKFPLQSSHSLCHQMGLWLSVRDRDETFRRRWGETFSNWLFPSPKHSGSDLGGLFPLHSSAAVGTHTEQLHQGEGWYGEQPSAPCCCSGLYSCKNLLINQEYFQSGGCSCASLKPITCVIMSESEMIPDSWFLLRIFPALLTLRSPGTPAVIWPACLLVVLPSSL